ncbi:MAG TPA: triple tyrosine motif-containing protein, partial [Roseiflexaceae bacterium]|nr:triple tyrosine motif-containing protein [Roseiflexaceae bacterium]
NHVLEVIEDQEGILWIGTFGDGLNRFDRTTGTFTAYRHDPFNPGSLSQNVVTVLYVDQHGTLWVGTGSGLNRFDRATGSFTRYTTEQGLIDNLIDGIVEVDGALWLATLNGLSRLDPQSSTFRNYNTVDTQLSQGFTVASMALASDGTIYAGGFGGFVTFKPALTANESFVAPVVFTDFQASSQPIADDETTAPHQGIDASGSMALPRGERTFGIEFAALDYWLPNHNRYRYMLEGIDKDWIEVDSQRRFITYANLRPGTYTLRVAAANDEECGARRPGHWRSPSPHSGGRRPGSQSASL